MKEIRAVPAQMMFLELWFEAASADYRGEAASIPQPVLTSGERWRQERGPILVPAFCTAFPPPTFPSSIWFPSASISCKEQMTFSDIALWQEKSVRRLEVPMHPLCLLLASCAGQKAASQPGVCCDCALHQQQGQEEWERQETMLAGTKYFCPHHWREKTAMRGLQQRVTAAITLLVHTCISSTHSYNPELFISTEILRISPCRALHSNHLGVSCL